MRQERGATGAIVTSLALITFVVGLVAGTRLPSQPAGAAAATPTGHWQATSFEAGEPDVAITQGNAFLATLGPSCQVAPSLAATSNPPAFVFVVAYRC